MQERKGKMIRREICFLVQSVRVAAELFPLRCPCNHRGTRRGHFGGSIPAGGLSSIISNVVH
jgi:hypothetical protein